MESFNVELLESFCSLRLCKQVTDVTEGQIIAEIQALLAKVKYDDVPDIKLLFKQELKMDMKETDVDAQREKCKRLISCLASPVLNADVKTAVRWTNIDAVKDIQKLYTLAYNKAVEHERHFQKNKRMRMAGKEENKSGNKPGLSKPDTVSGKAVQFKKTAVEKKESPQQKTDKKADKLTDKKIGRNFPRRHRRPAQSVKRCIG
ncbi:unnamed protein product [Phytophthora fragariaefolia]|uniref:Unnamed protein product n=1 Tax=Phytophthora fragariaefolia TaxID=1490495 RepID=A0A9W6YCN5_9STRA|nr:unnamed protein product [Phytophthora fragariaefolia]